MKVSLIERMEKDRFTIKSCQLHRTFPPCSDPIKEGRELLWSDLSSLRNLSKSAQFSSVVVPVHGGDEGGVPEGDFCERRVDVGE